MQVLREKHQVLLNDEVRVSAYERALQAIVKPGDIVADLGCGLGVLSFIAARAGAARIHAVEIEPETMSLAKEEAKAAGLSSRIHFLEGLVQEIDVPERVDVVVTETMGSLGLDENILSLLIDAKRYWLKPGAVMCPQQLAVTIVPTSLASTQTGLQPHAELIAPATFLAAPATSQPVVFAKATNKNFVTELSFRIEHDGLLRGFAGWFDVWLTDDVHFATGPDSAPTHWQQAFLPIREPVALHAGQTMDFVLGIGPDDSGLESIIEFDFVIRDE